MIDRANETLGVIHVSTNSHGDTFSRDDLELLKGMATPAAIMLQNTRMHEDSLVEDRFRHDLALAAQIQKSFLPREVIAVEGLELFAEYRAAYTVGGDFYDVFWVGTDRLAVFIGDISGKGISGALLMARISSELRVAALAHVDPVAVLIAMNSATLGRAQPELFFTAIYLTIDVKTGEVVLANAGHPTPYWCRSDGTVEPVSGGAACAVGILDDGGYTSTSFSLARGEYARPLHRRRRRGRQRRGRAVRRAAPPRLALGRRKAPRRHRGGDPPRGRPSCGGRTGERRPDALHLPAFGRHGPDDAASPAQQQLSCSIPLRPRAAAPLNHQARAR